MIRMREEIRTKKIRGEVINKFIQRWANGDHLNLFVSINGCPVCNSWFAKEWLRPTCELDRLSPLIATVTCPDCSCPVRAKLDPPLWRDPVPKGKITWVIA